MPSHSPAHQIAWEQRTGDGACLAKTARPWGRRFSPCRLGSPPPTFPRAPTLVGWGPFTNQESRTSRCVYSLPNLKQPKAKIVN